MQVCDIEVQAHSKFPSSHPVYTQVQRHNDPINVEDVEPALLGPSSYVRIAIDVCAFGTPLQEARKELRVPDEDAARRPIGSAIGQQLWLRLFLLVHLFSGRFRGICRTRL